MKKPIFAAILALLFMSAVLGWLSGNTQTSQSAAQSDNWDTVLKTQKTSFDYSALAQDLKSSGLLPIRAEQRAGLATGGGGTDPQAQDVPPFPDIKSVYSTDGVLNVLMKLSDNSLVAAKAGDTIENGWTLISISLTEITAVFNGEEQQFPVVAYKNEKVDTDTE